MTSSESDDRQPMSDGQMRSHLANERTFLAWLRTGITLIALGLVAAQFLAGTVLPGLHVTRGIAVSLVVCGAFLVLSGARRYFTARRDISHDLFQPAGASVIVAMLLMLLISVLAIFFILLIH